MEKETRMKIRKKKMIVVKILVLFCYKKRYRTNFGFSLFATTKE